MRREYIIFGGIVAVILLLLIAPKLNKEKSININDIISEEPVENQEELMSELLREDREYTEEVTNIVKEPTKSEDNISPPTKTTEDTGGTEAPTGGTDAPTGGTEAPTEGTEATTEGTDVTTEGTDSMSQDGPSEEMPKEFSKTWDNVVALLCKHYVCKTLPEEYMIFLSDKGKDNYSLVSPDKELKPQFIYDYSVDRDKQLVVITTDKSEVIKFKYYLTNDLVDNIERLKK